MRCSAGDMLCAEEEKHAHRVRITRGFEMGKYQITSAQWRAVTIKPPVVLIRSDGNEWYGKPHVNCDPFFFSLSLREDLRSSCRTNSRKWRVGSHVPMTEAELPAAAAGTVLIGSALLILSGGDRHHFGWSAALLKQAAHCPHCGTRVKKKQFQT